MKHGQRVRIHPSYLLQGQNIEGEVINDTDSGIYVRDDRGVERFLPWTSVGFVTLNPEAIDSEPF